MTTLEEFLQAAYELLIEIPWGVQIDMNLMTILTINDSENPNDI